MTADALLVLQTLFKSIWMLFNSWYIPGTNVTPAAFFIFLLCARFILGLSAHFSIPFREGTGETGLVPYDKGE